MADGCELCRHIERLRAGGSPYLVAELSTGYAVLGDNQTYRGYTLFLSKTCVPELHLLEPGLRRAFLGEMALVAEAVFRAFSPRKLNHELLGNSVPHLHWHLFPRYDDDPNPRWPIWNNEAFTGAAAATAEQIAPMRERLSAELRGLLERTPG